MNGSSETNTNAFDGLTLHRALALVEALEKSKLRTEHQVRRVFSRNSQRFGAALAFLIRVGVVQENEGCLAFRTEPPAASSSDRQAWLLARLLRVRNRYRSEMFSYLRKYRVEGGELVYHSPVQRWSRESAVRNFLMEMGIVRHDRKEARHIISRDYVSLYARATETRRAVSPESLTRSIVARDDLGFSAEKTVMKFEQHRLGPDLANEVDHVSLRNVAAGYDIRSLTVTDGKERVPRYIEVKAVSASSMCFYWTHNEIAVAQTLEEVYFLYLLPVSSEGSFDLSRLRIIPDPHKAVLTSQKEWIIESDVIRCSLRRQCSAPHKSTGVL
jgi:hypothetical protein